MARDAVRTPLRVLCAGEEQLRSRQSRASRRMLQGRFDWNRALAFLKSLPRSSHHSTLLIICFKVHSISQVTPRSLSRIVSRTKTNALVRVGGSQP